MFQDLRAFVGQEVEDDIIVWLSRVVAQDVNIFDGPSLLASSERNLFASGLLPSRTPGEVYRAVFVDGRPYYVGHERAGGLELWFDKRDKLRVRRGKIGRPQPRRDQSLGVVARERVDGVGPEGLQAIAVGLEDFCERVLVTDLPEYLTSDCFALRLAW